MNWINSILILLAAFVAVVFETSFGGIRHLLGAQIDLLPALIVYASLRTNLVTVTLLSVLGGLWFDTFSDNPLGITILPLFLAGFLIHPRRDLILREQYYAQFVLGLSASALVPLVVVLLLLSARQSPILGWGTICQCPVFTLAVGFLT